jgi:hypothetical protein
MQLDDHQVIGRGLHIPSRIQASDAAIGVMESVVEVGH